MTENTIENIPEVANGSASVAENERKTLKQKIRDVWGDASPKEVFTKAAAEFLGTLLLVMIGCMGCLPGWGPTSSMQSAITFGLVVMFVIQITGHISGAHVNPAVTLCVLMLNMISIPLALVYVISQIAGATLGYGLLLVITPNSAYGANANGSGSFCCTVPSDEISAIQAVIVEIIITSVLIFLVCAIFDHRNSKNTDGVSIKFGLTISALAMAAGPYTGASMNPARSLGPALWCNHWTYHWVYWVGPLLGSALASMIYITLFKVTPQRPQREEQPLNEFRKSNANTEVA